MHTPCLGCVERVMRIAARLTGGIPRTGHISGYMLDVLHWFPFPQQIIFQIAVLAWWCLLGPSLANPHKLCCSTPGTRPKLICTMEKRDFLSLLPVPPHDRPVPSQCGMGFQLFLMVHSDTSFYSRLKTVHIRGREHFSVVT